VWTCNIECLYSVEDYSLSTNDCLVPLQRGFKKNTEHGYKPTKFPNIRHTV